MSLLYRRDGYSRITHNDRCPRRPLVQLALAASAGLVALWAVPGSHPYFVMAGVLIVTAVLSLIIRVTVRRKRSRAGACLTCDHPCVQQLPGTQMSKDPVPVPVQLGRRHWTDNAHVWQELQAFDRSRGQ